MGIGGQGPKNYIVNCYFISGAIVRLWQHFLNIKRVRSGIFRYKPFLFA